MPRSDAAGHQLAQPARGSSAATISSTASAPAARASSELVLVDHEVLAQQRQVARPRGPRPGRRGCRRSSSRLGEHRDRAARRPAGRRARSRRRSRPGGSGPRDGLARFISAISEMPSSISASEKGRAAARRARGAARSSAAGSARACAPRASAWVRSTTVSRKVGIGPGSLRPARAGASRATNASSRSARGAARRCSRARCGTASSSVGARPDSQMRGGRVQHHHVARGPRRARQHRAQHAGVVGRVAAGDVAVVGGREAELDRVDGAAHARRSRPPRRRR